MKGNHSFVQRFVVLIILYIYIYNPVFIVPGFGLLNLLLFLSILYSLYHKKVFKKALYLYKKEFRLMVLMILYVFLIKTVNGITEYSSINSMIVWAITTVIIPISLISTIFSSWNEDKMIDILLEVGFIASIISFFCLVSPIFNEMSRSIQIPDELENIQDGTVAFRCYGIATNLTSSYGIIQGVMASYALYRIKNNPVKYFMYFIFMTVSAAINARTGLLPVIITGLYMLIISLKRNMIKTIPVLMIIVVLLTLFVNYFKNHFYETYDFVFSFFDAIYKLLVSRDIEGLPWFNSLEIFIRFPDSIRGLVFGEGYTIMNADAFENSDIGYINQIFLGGLVFLSMLLYYEYRLYKNLWIRSNKSYIIIILFITALLINLKGVSFYLSNAYTRFVMLLYFYYSISSSKKLDVIP